MQTRSQTKVNQISKYEEYEVNIDFDHASACWRQNKKDTGNGHYKYICTALKKDDTICGKSCYKDLMYCWSHRKSANK